jgi:hypothetical protein
VLSAHVQVQPHHRPGGEGAQQDQLDGGTAPPGVAHAWPAPAARLGIELEPAAGALLEGLGELLAGGVKPRIPGAAAVTSALLDASTRIRVVTQPPGNTSKRTALKSGPWRSTSW